MTFTWFKKIWAAALLAVTPAIAYAQSAEELTQNWFYAETQSERVVQLNKLQEAAKADNTARFGLGAVKFFSAIEGFSQDMLSYGLASHAEGAQSRFPLPLPLSSDLRFPLPNNTTPATLTYDGLRVVLTDFETNLELARATLASVDPNEPVSIDISFYNARFDVTEDDSISENHSFLNLLATSLSEDLEDQSVEELAQFGFRFDNADAIWLEGYSNVILSQIDFLLAHDFSRAFDASFHMFFPKSNLPLQDELIPNGYGGQPGVFGDEKMIADVISLIHLLDWPVVEPHRRADVAHHMTEVARLSRANWAAIRTETDNEKEWLPGPHQPGTHPTTGIEVTEPMVEGWMQTMQLLEDVMAGERLIPHWRFENRGLNLKRYFESTENFDPVLLLTGPGALPYLEQGNIITRQEWRNIQNLVGRRNFGMIAAWFN